MLASHRVYQGMEKDEKDLPQEIEGAHINKYTLITQWDGSCRS